MANSPENQDFQNFCSYLKEKLLLEVYKDKSNVIQVLESNYRISSNKRPRS